MASEAREGRGAGVFKRQEKGRRRAKIGRRDFSQWYNCSMTTAGLRETKRDGGQCGHIPHRRARLA